MSKNDKKVFLTKKKKIILFTGIGLLIIGGGILFFQSMTYRKIEFQWYLKQEQKRRDREWGYLDYSGHEVVNELTEEFIKSARTLVTLVMR